MKDDKRKKILGISAITLALLVLGFYFNILSLDKLFPDDSVLSAAGYVMSGSSNQGSEIIKVSKPLAVSTCTPDAGYTYCDVYTYSYGSATARVTMMFEGVSGINKGGYYVGPAYVKIKTLADKQYSGNNVATTWDNLWNNVNCGSSGCSGTSIPLVTTINLATPGQNYKGCPVYYAWDRMDATNGDWAWTTGGRGWIGTSGTCLDLKSVNCYDNTDCNSGSFCDKSGTWDKWSCKIKQCDTGQTQCVGNDYYTCDTSTYTWKNNGKLLGQCQVECLTDGDEKCEGTNLFRCLNYRYASIGVVKDKCNVQCLNNIDCQSLNNQTQPVCVGKEIRKTMTTGICDYNSGYQCSTQISEEVIETCYLSCDNESNMCLEKTTKFRNYVIMGGLILISLVSFMIYLVLIKRRKRK